MAGEQQMPPQGPPAAEAPPEGGGEGGNQLGDLLQNLATGISILEETMVGAGVRPDLGQKVSAIKAELMSVVDEISKGGPAPQDSGQVPMEAGASGVPHNPAMR